MLRYFHCVNNNTLRSITRRMRQEDQRNVSSQLKMDVSLLYA